MSVSWDFVYLDRARKHITASQSTVLCVRGPIAPKNPCILTPEFSLDAAGGAR
jgi:hypothetical protein